MINKPDGMKDAFDALFSVFEHTFKQGSKMNESSACYCMGPRNGEPACPCKMRSMKQKNGRWVQETDFGPVNNVYDDIDIDEFTKKWLDGKPISERRKKSRFEDLPKKREVCRDPSHNPPMYMVVPPGKVYIHVCPSCGAEGRIYPSPISFEEHMGH